MTDTPFDRFKRAYPRRHRPHAWKKARELFEGHLRHGVEPEAIIEGAEQYARECEEDDKARTQFVCMPETWLRQERWWREEPEVERPSGRFAQDRCFSCLGPAIGTVGVTPHCRSEDCVKYARTHPTEGAPWIDGP